MTSASPGELVGLEAIRVAAARLRGVARRTPLLAARLPLPAAGGAAPGPEIRLKCESLQHGGAFKLRGAYNFLCALPAADRERGVVTYSSGNHAQGVAYAARAFGVPAAVVMPEDVPSIKLEGTRALGAEVELAGTTTTERRARAEEILATRGGTMVPPFDHPDIIAGQGTVGLEIREQCEETVRGDEPARPALVVVPVGGGGLVSGVAAALRALEPGVRVVGVEPEGAAKMRRSLDAGGPVTLESIDTIADGLRPVRPGDLTFAHCRALVDDVVTVADDAIRRAVLWCYDRRLVVEPSGAAGVAALLSGRVPPADPAEGATVVVVSGGNLEPGLLCAWAGEA
ncbi:MAG: threonine/serine dehydratase [Gemmatimonadota bacterium]